MTSMDMELPKLPLWEEEILMVMDLLKPLPLVAVILMDMEPHKHPWLVGEQLEILDNMVRQ